MTTADPNFRAAANVLAHSLRLRADQNVLLFVDEVSYPLVEVFQAAAAKQQISCSAFFVPRFQQAGFGPDDHLPAPIQVAIDEAHGLFSALSPHADCTDFRRSIVKLSCSKQRRTVHAPGFELGMLAYIDVDYQQIAQDCRLLAQALVLGGKVEIITHDENGVGYLLTAPLDGWEMPPGISNGALQDSEWANLPPGETFVVPVSGNGAIAITGSLPGRSLGNAAALVLHFFDGNCVDYTSSDPDLIDFFYATQIAPAEAQGDFSWRNLAEIGFGVNRMIQQLWGVELVDEKMAGTIHIALGDSEMLGGHVSSTIHCDLVCTGATVKIDGKPVLVDGRLTIDPQDWLLDYRTIDSSDSPWHTARGVRRSASRIEEEDLRLHRVYGLGLGRSGLLAVGNPATAGMANLLYGLLPNGRSWVDRDTVTAQVGELGIPPAALAALFKIMDQYGLVRFREDAL